MYRRRALLINKDNFIDALGGLSLEEIVRRSGLRPRTIQKAQAGKSCDEATIRGLARAARKNASAFVDWKAEQSIRGMTDTERAWWINQLDHGGINDYTFDFPIGLQSSRDLKNLITDLGLSARLLKLTHVPAFSECVTSSLMFSTSACQQKDDPRLEGFTYNHFFQPALIIRVQHAGERFVLAYHRTPRFGSSQYSHTQGMSIIWAASYCFGLSGRVLSEDGNSLCPMDKWVLILERDRERAAEALVGGPQPILVTLLLDKIDLRRQLLQIHPFGVVTNDQRSDHQQRVYTQYVFVADITADESALHQLSMIRRRELEMRLLPPRPEYRECFRSIKGTNLMDMVLWEAMLKERKKHRIETARFVRGFSIVSSSTVLS